MKKEDKERVVAELTERLRTTETLLVADYRGLTMPQIDDLRSKLIEHGARFSVVKNTLTRRAAEAAGSTRSWRCSRARPRSRSWNPTGIRSQWRRPWWTRPGRPGCSRFVGACSRAGRSRPPKSMPSRSCRRSMSSAARCSRRSSGRSRGSCPVHGAVAGPVRPDRRPHRAARGAGRHVGAAVAEPQVTVRRGAAAEAEPEPPRSSTRTTSRSRAGEPKPKPKLRQQRRSSNGR